MARADLRTEENIKIMKELREKGKTYKEIAEYFQCSSTLISSILKAKQISIGRGKLIYSNGEIINKIQIIERDYNPPWKGHETAYKVKCLKCKEYWTARKSDIQRGEHDCNHKKGGRGHGNLVKGTKFGFLTITGNFKSHKGESGKYSTYYEVQCECGSKPFYVRKEHLTGQGGRHSHTISCGCNSKSSGEIKISQLLDILQIQYKEQYSIPELSQFMKFDFAIFDGQNLRALIEYDGVQHFKIVEKWGGEEKLKTQQERDKRKDEYCKKKGIPLIRIPYTDFKVLDEEYLLSRIPKI